jgi:hypothetical protein
MDEQTNSAMDPETKKSPVHLSIDMPERSSRGLALSFLFLLVPKLIILIPHLIIVYVLQIASFVVTIIANFAILFTGKYPPAMHRFVVGVVRWQARVSSFMLGLVDQYPPYRLED